MKNLKSLMKAVCLVICLSFAERSVAQVCSCPGTGYYVKNSAACDVVISVEVMDVSCQFLCGTVAMTLTSGSTYWIPCCNTSAVDVYVTLLAPTVSVIQVNGVSMSNCNNGLVTPSSNSPSSNMACPAINMLWTCSGVVIN